MTIKEAAQQYGISPQAVYQRLKKQGIDVKTIKNKAGELTKDGEKIMFSLFDRSTVEGEGTQAEAEQAREKLEAEAAKQAEADKRSIEVLKVEVEYLKKQVESLENDKAQLTAALDNAQRLHAMTLNQMQRPMIQEKQGFFARLSAHFKKPTEGKPDDSSGKV